MTSQSLGPLPGVRRFTPIASRTETTHLAMPFHMNPHGSLFGGMVVQWIDVCAGVSAMRHAGMNAVTASIDRLDFLSPVRVGDVVILQSQVNYVARSSMEVGCRVLAENPSTGERRHTTKAFLTFVALDNDYRPAPVPDLVLETEEDRRRFADGARRREERLRLAGRNDTEG